jgi:hypothetical protein
MRKFKTVLDIQISCFEFVWDFDIRISDFPQFPPLYPLNEKVLRRYAVAMGF